MQRHRFVRAISGVIQAHGFGGRLVGRCQAVKGGPTEDIYGRYKGEPRKAVAAGIKGKELTCRPDSMNSCCMLLQCEGKPYKDKSDIWAVGCILYEMACQQKTFDGSNLPAVVNKIMKVCGTTINGSSLLFFF